jgi:hypothetical protein
MDELLKQRLSKRSQEQNNINHMILFIYEQTQNFVFKDVCLDWKTVKKTKALSTRKVMVVIHFTREEGSDTRGERLLQNGNFLIFDLDNGYAL